MNKPIPDWVKGTLLESILDFNGEIPESQDSNDPIAEGETQIGELTQYEQAVRMALNKALKEFHEAVEAHEAVEHDHGPSNPLCANLKKLDKVTDILSDMLWSSIEGRLGSQSLGVREGTKIVSRPAEKAGNGKVGVSIIGLGKGMEGLMEMLGSHK